jgi:hypothetical protein
MSEAPVSGAAPTDGNTPPEVTHHAGREGGLLARHRLFHVERRSKSEIARDLRATIS